MIHTNRCKHCGKKKEHHFFTFIPNQSGFCDHVVRRGDNPRMFYDSGLAALDDHKEELFEVINELKDFADAVLSNPEISETVYAYNHRKLTKSTLRKLQSILNAIKKEAGL